MARSTTHWLALVACMALAGMAAAYNTQPATTTCNVCWEWTLSGCQDSYYKGDMCNTAIHKLQYVLDDIGYAHFVEDYGCDKNRIWVCGSFESEASGKSFYDKFNSHYHNDDDLALSVIPDDDFCEAFPNAVVSIKSYDYTSKYDHGWNYQNNGWQPNKCQSCDIDLVYTCPPPPPPPKTGCSICYEWALSECNEHYYEGYMCKKALYQLTDALETVGQKDWIADYGCEGSKIWVCGSFQYVWQATYFLKRLQKTFPGNDDIALVGVPDEHFCDANPGAVVSVNTYDYTYKYDKTWKPANGWRKAVCSTAIIEVDYTCPHYQYKPTTRPSSYGPTSKPTTRPTSNPSSYGPSSKPTTRPTSNPSSYGPTHSKPTTRPTSNPSSYGPTHSKPTTRPTSNPSSYWPTSKPTTRPTSNPSSYGPTHSKPTTRPTSNPSSYGPTSKPTTRPTSNPSSYWPISKPATRPTSNPSYGSKPTVKPTTRPTSNPSYGSKPTVKPTTRPTSNPSYGSKPTVKPTTRPTSNPSYGSKPTSKPVSKPTNNHY